MHFFKTIGKNLSAGQIDLQLRFFLKLPTVWLVLVVILCKLMFFAASVLSYLLLLLFDV